MPNRIIKDTICESKGLSETSFFAEDLFKRLITYADDYGRFNADFQIILARLYPRELDIVKIEDIENAMIELCGVGKIAFYTDKARHSLYGCFPRWGDHQRIRDSKKKMPEPDDTSLNDWYFQRFVPISMKQEILIRDEFTCQECGIKIYVSDETIDPEISAKRLIKMATGTFHFDHIVPVCQGGRATLENLRLLCPKCNRTRKKKYTFEEILSFTLQKEENGGESQENIKSECDARQLAATRGNSRPNPIQSNPIRNQHDTHAREYDEDGNGDGDGEDAREDDQDEEDDRFDEFWDAYPKKTGDIKSAYFEYLGAIKTTAPETLIEAVKQQSKDMTREEFRYFQSAENWLKNKAWLTKSDFKEPDKKPKPQQDEHIPASTPPEKRRAPVNLATDLVEWPPRSGNYYLRGEEPKDAHE